MKIHNYLPKKTCHLMEFLLIIFPLCKQTSTKKKSDHRMVAEENVCLLNLVFVSIKILIAIAPGDKHSKQIGTMGKRVCVSQVQHNFVLKKIALVCSCYNRVFVLLT